MLFRQRNKRGVAVRTRSRGFGFDLQARNQTRQIAASSGRGTSALVRIPDSGRTLRHVRKLAQQLTCHAQSTWSIAVNCPARVYRQRHLKDGADAHRWLRFSHILSPMRQGAGGSFRPPGRSGALRRTARDFQYELGPDRLFEPVGGEI